MVQTTRLPAIGRRLGSFLLSLLVSSLIIFLLLNLLPGNVAQTILGSQADPAAVRELEEQMGLNRPWPVRYLEWLGGLLTFNLGDSVLSGRSVVSLIAPKLAVTLWLVGLGMALAVGFAIPVGMVAALHRRRPLGTVTSVISQLGMAVPAFLAGIVLVLIFSVTLRWLPANGYVPLLRDPLEWFSRLLLPAASLALVQGSVLVRYVRSAFLEVLNEDYMRTARSIGWPKLRALVRHGLRNAGLSIITVAGLQLATLLVGAIVVERVFVLPGLGSQLVDSVSNRDLPVVQSIVMLLVALVLVITTIIDLLYLVIDPRLRKEPT